jgi:hypothetical protein
MKINVTTTNEMEIDIEFPLFIKSAHSSTKWISEKHRITVFLDDVIHFRGSKFEVEHLKDERITEDEFNKIYSETINTINAEYGIKQYSEHPELAVSEG